ncbi:MAG: hypothetical protein J3K34DRAFT_410106, partial [Monoraphidium minutum]
GARPAAGGRAPAACRRPRRAVARSGGASIYSRRIQQKSRKEWSRARRRAGRGGVQGAGGGFGQAARSRARAQRQRPGRRLALGRSGRQRARPAARAVLSLISNARGAGRAWGRARARRARLLRLSTALMLPHLFSSPLFKRAGRGGTTEPRAPSPVHLAPRGRAAGRHSRLAPKTAGQG